MSDKTAKPGLLDNVKNWTVVAKLQQVLWDPFDRVVFGNPTILKILCAILVWITGWRVVDYMVTGHASSPVAWPFGYLSPFDALGPLPVFIRADTFLLILGILVIVLLYSWNKLPPQGLMGDKKVNPTALKSFWWSFCCLILLFWCTWG